MAFPHALRLELGGCTIAFSGDTGWRDTLKDVARDADLFICQAYAFSREASGFLSHRTIADHLAELGCRRSILHHIGPEMQARLGEATG